MPDIYLLLAIVSTFIYLATLVFLISGFIRSKTEKAAHQPAVSVVVAARNEAENLRKCLPALLSQTYPRKLLEFVVVNDRSSDRTAEILQCFTRENASFKRYILLLL